MIIGILLLALGGGAVALHSVYTVRTVYVEGNVHYTEDEIKEIVMAGPLGDNSLYLSHIFRFHLNKVSCHQNHSNLCKFGGLYG